MIVHAFGRLLSPRLYLINPGGYSKAFHRKKTVGCRHSDAASPKDETLSIGLPSIGKGSFLLDVARHNAETLVG